MARFWVALGLYILLAAVAVVQFRGPLRLALLAFLGGLAFKTWIAAYRR